jgi:hypothetical protein
MNNLGGNNTAFGNGALQTKQLGGLNTAIGSNALSSLTGLTPTNSGNNTAIGSAALTGLTAGDSNTAVGLEAGEHLTTGTNNIIMGFQAGMTLTTGSENIYIANPGAASESETIRIGNAQSSTFIAGINGNGPFGASVQIDPATGQLGTNVSSMRFKKDIDAMDNSSEAIFSLKPVTFHYKNDKTNTPQWGLIAEDVAKVNPALIAVDSEKKPYTVRYDQVNAMLLNEFLKEHSKVEKLEATVAKLVATVKEQAAQIQNVSAQLATANGAAGMRSDLDGPSREADASGSEQVNPSDGGLELNKSAPQTVLNNQ